MIHNVALFDLPHVKWFNTAEGYHANKNLPRQREGYFDNALDGGR